MEIRRAGPLTANELLWLLETVATRPVKDRHGDYLYHEIDFDVLISLIYPLVEAAQLNSLAFHAGDTDWKGATQVLDAALDRLRQGRTDDDQPHTQGEDDHG